MRCVFFLFLILYVNSFYGQQQDKVDFIRAQVLVEPIPEGKHLTGEVTYSFEILHDVDSIFLDARNMNFSLVKLNAEKVKFSNDTKRIVIHHPYKKGDFHTITLTYNCTPKQALYFVGWEDTISENEQIWTQGQGKYTSNWLPSFDDVNEKVVFDIGITIDPLYTVIANGKLSNLGEPREDGKVATYFNMQKPMSSYLLAFAIGSYIRTLLTSESGISLYNYIPTNKEEFLEPTYRYTKRIFDFLEEEIGYPYPWQNYKQIPVHDFLYAGMENTGTTIFSDGYVIDSIAFIDKNYTNVNAHELAHQWFGNLVTAKNGNHHWLQEGFATYYALIAEKEIFGEDHFYWKLYNTAKQLNSLSEQGKGEALTNPKASSLTFYEKGAWALYMLREELGDTIFKKGIQNYLKAYQFKNATIGDFLRVMENTSTKNLSTYRVDWLENSRFPMDNAKESLQKKSTSLRLLFSLEKNLKENQSDDLDYESYWNKTSSIFFKKYILEQFYKVLPDTIILDAFNSNSIALRQVLSYHLKELKYLSGENKTTLLQDKSYITQENTLLHLWTTFPENRTKYLDGLKATQGLPNKNIRLLWLVLAILTEDYGSEEKKIVFIEELTNYTDPYYSFEIRQNAFGLINEVFKFSDKNIKDLINACTHHSWQFRKYARHLLDELLVKDSYKSRLKEIEKQLKGREREYLISKRTTK